MNLEHFLLAVPPSLSNFIDRSWIILINQNDRIFIYMDNMYSTWTRLAVSKSNYRRSFIFINDKLTHAMHVKTQNWYIVGLFVCCKYYCLRCCIWVKIKWGKMMNFFLFLCYFLWMYKGKFYLGNQPLIPPHFYFYFYLEKFPHFFSYVYLIDNILSSGRRECFFLGQPLIPPFHTKLW